MQALVKMATVHHLNMTDLLDHFKQGTLTCEAYTRGAIKWAEELKHFNYFVSMDTDRMLKEAKDSDVRYKANTNRALEGVLIAIKDNIDVEGEATGAGTPGLAQLRPKTTAEVARRLFEAGAIHAGRTNMHELAHGPLTVNSHTGSSHNFYNFDYTCGGSSGGSGGAVAAGIVPVALGTDTAGSVRGPASYNGVFGMRPTVGRWPPDFGVKSTHLRDTVGPLVTSVTDIAILDHVMTGEEPHNELLPGDVRIGVSKPHFWEGLDAEVKEYAERFVLTLKQKGFVVVVVDEGGILGVDKMFDQYKIPSMDHELIPRLREYLRKNGHEVTAEELINQIATDDVRASFQRALFNPPGEDLMNAVMAAREKLKCEWMAFFERHQLDCLLMPASKIPPMTLISALESNSAVKAARINENADCASILDNPSIVIPGGFTRGSGVPFGMQIDGVTGNDRLLIAVAMTIEKSLDLSSNSTV
ncbi:mandelamide hydrolase-like isoform X1 [Asterias amurensis]|uniref:mandelamide hydrolase-like isoform X1 n=2 Tax=Asterias amurensis TaxID=7602 RepID=UPI003AB462EF